MLKKTITYVDYNGDERTEDFYFNLNKGELTEMEAELEGGMSGLLKQIVATEDINGILKIFKKIILASYGIKTADGKYFRKLDAEGHQLSIDFVSSPAFDELFLGLFKGDANVVADFIKGIMPADLAKEIDAKMAAEKDVPKVIEMTAAEEAAPTASTSAPHTD